MKCTGDFLLGANPSQVWTVVNDPERLVSLISGVQVAGREGHDIICRADVTVGSFSCELAGRIHIVESDESVRRVVIEARTIQAGDAANSLRVALRLQPVDKHTRITVDTEACLTGELGAVDGPTLQHSWERLLRRTLERLDLAFIGPVANQPESHLLKYAATGVAAAFQSIVGFATGHPFNPLRLFRRPSGEWTSPPRDPH